MVRFMMASGPICSTLSCHKLCLSTYIIGGIRRKQTNGYHVADMALKVKSRETLDSCCMFCSLSVPIRSSNEVSLHKFYSMGRQGKSNSGSGYQRDRCDSDSSITLTANSKRQLRTLDTYFSKLQVGMDKKLSSGTSESDSEIPGDSRKNTTFSSETNDDATEVIDSIYEDKAETGLTSLENYFGRLSDIGTEKRSLSNFQTSTSERNPVRIPSTVSREDSENDETVVEPYTYKDKRGMDDRTDSLFYPEGNIGSLSTDDEVSDLYLISLLAAINIAVFLFEIASPVSWEVEKLSIPLIYGAKINKLILLGEWWRLLTPMFLHTGLLHVAFSCWVLLTYGPKVCKGYGPFTFFLIYVLGGICGNLASFVHTPELTVCGTGPVFAVLGAWLVYQFQTKEAAPKEASQIMFWKAVAATALSFVLCSFWRVDNWAHVGAAISGVVFGLLTCPSFAFDNSRAKNSQKEGIVLFQRQADPCKSLATFTMFLFLLASLFFLCAPDLQLLEWDDLS